MKCALCGRTAVTEFCMYHQAAKEKVEAAFLLWKEAYGTIEWKDYLDRVIYNPQTGQWSKEIAEMLRGV
jgi:hypothetical protein